MVLGVLRTMRVRGVFCSAQGQEGMAARLRADARQHRAQVRAAEHHHTTMEQMSSRRTFTRQRTRTACGGWGPSRRVSLFDLCVKLELDLMCIRLDGWRLGAAFNVRRRASAGRLRLPEEQYGRTETKF